MLLLCIGETICRCIPFRGRSFIVEQRVKPQLSKNVYRDVGTLPESYQVPLASARSPLQISLLGSCHPIREGILPVQATLVLRKLRLLGESREREELGTMK
ncbi:hypothetical protein PAXRUDRAFT_703723 [Paxillus rubicundulus Ve08.2h10]|uniref:Uncharacterized protein n=1 Tax=Paxillus rubicundulus Ve08.2h10 TaxID=930991 RepID=A0A0D0DMK9_9AGAM|nr:hypothetical protein PAXRUDRAFT_703723 [Paxillus rubicundulus Ve08.2h10]